MKTYHEMSEKEMENTRGGLVSLITVGAITCGMLFCFLTSFAIAHGVKCK